MILEDNERKYIESGLYHFDELKESTLIGDQMLCTAILRAKKFFQKKDMQLHLGFIREFYGQYHNLPQKMKKGLYHNLVCSNLGIQQSAGYVIRDDIIERIALCAATIGLMKFE